MVMVSQWRCSIYATVITENHTSVELEARCESNKKVQDEKFLLKNTTRKFLLNNGWEFIGTPLHGFDRHVYWRDALRGEVMEQWRAVELQRHRNRKRR